jgi:hypothetical protein
MTQNEILRATQVHFDELLGVWSANADHKGMGALVFVSGDDASPQQEINFAYLTLKDLGDYLRRFNDNHEFVHRVVKQAESVQGIPFMIIPSGIPGGGEFLTGRVTTRRVERPGRRFRDTSTGEIPFSSASD